MRRGDAGDYGQRPGGLGPLFEQPAAGSKMERIEGPFSKSAIPPSPAELMVGSVIWRHRGRGNPVSIARIVEICGSRGVGNERTVKAIVEQLRLTHRMDIGARRTEPSGYFMMIDAEDVEVGLRPYREQVLSGFRLLRTLDSPERLRELLGQLRIDG